MKEVNDNVEKRESSGFLMVRNALSVCLSVPIPILGLVSFTIPTHDKD